MTKHSQDNPLAIAVLISGSGSNLQSLMDHCDNGYIPGRIVRVISNVPNVYGLVRAKNRGIPTAVIDHRDFTNREDFEKALLECLDEAKVGLVCLAGFMRILTRFFVERFAHRLINIHPALLPMFCGLNVQKRAIDAGVRFSGATVHFVNQGVDTGPIIAQAVVPVLPQDDAHALASRILEQEHRLYPLAVRLFALGKLKVEANRVMIIDNQENADMAIFNPPLPISNSEKVMDG